MKTVREFINAVLEAGNWDIRDAFDDIIARDAEHEEEKAALRATLTETTAMAEDFNQQRVALGREVDRLRKLADRATGIVDEWFGPFPVMTADEALTKLEAELFVQRQRYEAMRGESKHWCDHATKLVSDLIAADESRAGLANAVARAEQRELDALAELDEAAAVIRMVQASGAYVGQSCEEAIAAWLARHSGSKAR